VDIAIVIFAADRRSHRRSDKASAFQRRRRRRQVTHLCWGGYQPRPKRLCHDA